MAAAAAAAAVGVEAALGGRATICVKFGAK